MPLSQVTRNQSFQSIYLRDDDDDEDDDEDESDPDPLSACGALS